MVGRGGAVLGEICGIYSSTSLVSVYMIHLNCPGIIELLLLFGAHNSSSTLD
jgi:hypothetical protein